MQEFSASKTAIRATLFIAYATAILAILKVSFGIVGHSHALIADGIHSAADLLIDVLILFAAHYANQKADHNHPYGHGRIETAATLGLAMLLVIAGVIIIIHATEHVLSHQLIPAPSWYVVIIAVISIVINEALFQYTYRIADEINSNLLRANAWHCRSDAAASFVVLIGVVGSILGYPHLDAIAAIIVGILVIKLGTNLGWSSVRELVDTGVDDYVLQKIKNSINTVPGVKTLHQLRTRTINKNILVDVHILVAPHLSVSEGHYIGEQVRFHLFNDVSNISDVTVHVDPEDDEIEEYSLTLPGRSELLRLLTPRWQKIYPEFDNNNIVLHYLAGKIQIEVRLPRSLLNTETNPNALINQFLDAVKDLPMIAKVDIFFS